MPHCMLRSSETYVRVADDAASGERWRGEAHHDLRAADERDGEPRVELGTADQLRDDADAARPAAARAASTVTANVEAAARHSSSSSR